MTPIHPNDVAPVGALLTCASSRCSNQFTKNRRTHRYCSEKCAYRAKAKGEANGMFTPKSPRCSRHQAQAIVDLLKRDSDARARYLLLMGHRAAESLYSAQTLLELRQRNGFALEVPCAN